MTPLSAKMEPSLSQSHTTRPSKSKEGSIPQYHRDSSGSRSRSHSRSSSGVRRASFGSVKEDIDGIAQSFLDTTTKLKDDSGHITSDMAAAVDQMPEFCCPCGGFMGWKQIRLRGRKMSKSYSDLSLLGHRSSSTGWMWDTTGSRPTIKEVPAEIEPRRARLTIEDLPVEVLIQIISYLAVELPPNGYTPRNVDLISCLLTSRTLHSATLSVLYRNITIPHSVIFSKLLKHLIQFPALGTIVRRLDFSHFTSVGLGRTRQMNAEIQNLTSKTLLQCLDLLPNLMEGLFQEHLETDINTAVVQKIFGGLPKLRTVDFCGCSSQTFSTGFMEAFSGDSTIPLYLPQLKRLSLHECSGLPSAIFEKLLPRLVNVTHLDLGRTQVTATALLSLPTTAQITHLNLSKCLRLSGSQVVNFLTTHPAVTESLVYLNLMSDPSRYRLLESDDVTALLPKLPSTLRSLNLNGARITSEHVPLLLPLAKHLEELGLSGADLSPSDLNSFFVPQDSESEKRWQPSTLHYLDVSKVASITLQTLFNPRLCVLVSPQSLPLEVIELGDKLMIPLRDRTKSAKSNGWSLRELGRRGWYVREPIKTEGAGEWTIDDGSRSWKMGARWWGMRKIPVTVGEVGGIYGHYMFKK
ncbi:Leucine Rich Repeat domain protein [Talaromyces stipitatus ATCC 10500]|uniref:Leucine Rich Repeat domain protein n=1 Tax=Talaromyces stipitatus (strain ATCC 10500 / CBS 375.48 / QM 6759 / NRRL 1006) TaxID=441959 RepID=B8LVU1_TALSN|nr:Leucine Rich Repeat domain protein [Talaromyces stipitatus ATCC 10500]EED24221.1 Leucine Rich Repeat domain protein [Talaromyces stipitatus ATCC 10500]